MLEFQVFIHVGVVRHLLIANETDVCVAKPAFICSDKLQDQLPSIPNLHFFGSEIFSLARLSLYSIPVPAPT